MTDQYIVTLHWLLELIQGKNWPYSKGITSYDLPELEHHDLHQACLTLERQGKIVRYLEEGAMIAWMPVDEEGA
jgi:hypothetical protein